MQPSAGQTCGASAYCFSACACACADSFVLLDLYLDLCLVCRAIHSPASYCG